MTGQIGPIPFQPSDQPKAPADHDQATICFENVSKSFGQRKVLDGVSFSVLPREAVCILGRSGTGKSVTLKLMIGLLRADQGRVLVQGNDIGNLKERELSLLRRKMGFLFQNAALFDSFPLFENLALPMRRLHSDEPESHIRDTIMDVLKQVGLEKEADKMPVDLSGGMRKRAGLARAIMLQPEILLVDEPSSGLDRITASEIDELLIKVKEEQHASLVIVTHDVHGARRVGDKMAVLDEGKLIAFGAPEELDKQSDEQVKKFIGEPGE